MINSFNYLGIVNISDGVSTITTHNNGKIGVSNLFTRAVLGYPSDNQRPVKFDIIKYNTGKSILTEKVQIRSSTFETILTVGSDYNNWYYPVLSIIVLSEQISLDYTDLVDRGPSRTNNKYYFTLYNALDEEFASVLITMTEPSDDGDNENTLYYHDGNNILIKWYMYISNRDED